jgi:hypothetical protein
LEVGEEERTVVVYQAKVPAVRVLFECLSEELKVLIVRYFKGVHRED